MPSGGKRRGSGRRFAAGDRLPRRGSKLYYKLMAMARAYGEQDGEFFGEIADAPLPFLHVVFKSRLAPLRYRMAAAIKLLEYEGQAAPILLSDDVTSGEALNAAIHKLRLGTPASERARCSLAEIFADDAGNLSPEDAEWIEEIVAEVERRRPPVAAITDILLPAKAAPTVRKPFSDVADTAADAAQSGANPAAVQTSRQAIHKSVPETLHEITPEETAVLAAIQHLPHLRRN